VAAAETYPADLKYHSEHDWARIEGGEAVFGITWKAQDMLGELVFFQPPVVGAKLEKDALYGEVESVKAVSDLVAPLSGTVVAVNEKVQSEPEAMNDDPYGEGWLVRVQLDDPGEAEILLDAETYKQLAAEE
jgi:glycine cleavage system H protein